MAIPTFERPAFVRRAVASVLAQTRPPDEVLVVYRGDDHGTIATFDELKAMPRAEIIRFLPVHAPGMLPPIFKAVEECSGDVIVFMDDDAVAYPDWLQRLCSFYADPVVGGVGGRAVDWWDGAKVHHPPVRTVGKLHWYGRLVGNMYRDFIPDRPTDVDSLMGGNMSYRAALVRECLPDARLSHNVSFYWELDVALRVKAKGYRLVYDPHAIVDHYSAPRSVAGLRTPNSEGVYWSNYNYAFIMMSHLSLPRRACFLAYTSLVGDGNAPGLVKLAQLLVKGTRGLPALFFASVRGRLAGVRDGLRASAQATPSS